MAETLYEPGARISVEMTADVNGDVAGPGDLVEIVGETSADTQVALNQTDGRAIGPVVRFPVDDNYDPDETYAAGDAIGRVMVKLRHAVDWVSTVDAYTPTAGDLVVSAAGGGVRAYDTDGTAPDDTADMIFGMVFSTNQRGTEYADDVAVVRFK